ncbi:MAG TPA: M1 family metallopeptidase [Rhodothermales bacterium]|nr:M1 family metallopeptidase [Rhodothermales bacterium]
MSGVDVVHYEVDLHLDPATRMLQARTRLTVQHPDTLTRLSLLLRGMNVDSVLVDSSEVEVNREGSHWPIPLSPGKDTSQVDLHYHGVPETGFYERASRSQSVFFSDAWPTDGSGWLPGIHHPADPATLTLRLTIPFGYEAAATGTPQFLDTLGGAVRYQWHLDVPAPTYAFAFAVADFSIVEASVGDTLPVRYYMLAEDAADADLLRRTPAALAYFSEVFGPYPFASYASVEVPIRYAGMENAAAAFLQPELFRTGEAEVVQVHELAHQWFGNRVPIASWNDLWLSEGTATYLETLFFEHADGLAAAREQWVVLADMNPFRRRTHTVLVPAEPQHPNTLLTWVPYDKGASVLHLLRRKLGDITFFEAFRTVYTRHAGRPLSTKVFQQIMEDVSEQDLSDFFAYWVYEDRLPVLDTKWDAITRTLAWQIIEDGGTLADVSFELQVQQQNRIVYVDVRERKAILAGWDEARPDVHPVGVLMNVR